jgi:hypothetical protein
MGDRIDFTTETQRHGENLKIGLVGRPPASRLSRAFEITEVAEATEKNSCGGQSCPMPRTFPTAEITNNLVGRTPWSARDALVPPVREESDGCDHRGAGQGVGRGRGRPPHYLCNCPQTEKLRGIRQSCLHAGFPAGQSAESFGHTFVGCVHGRGAVQKPVKFAAHRKRRPERPPAARIGCHTKGCER